MVDIPSWQHGYDSEQHSHSINVEEIFAQLFGKDTLPEAEAGHLQSQLDLWYLGQLKDQLLQGMETPRQRALYLEQQLVKRELRRMQEDGRKVILSPRQEKLLNDLTERLRGEIGGGVILDGPPGGGKSQFLSLLAERLADGRNVREVNGSPLTTSAELIGTKAIHPRETYAMRAVQTLSELSQLTKPEEQADQLAEFLVSALTELNPGIERQSSNQQGKLARQLQAFGFTNLPETISLTSESMSEVVTSQESLSLERLSSFWSAHARMDRQQGLHQIVPGPIYYAGRNGEILIINEADKMGIDGMALFGHGAEEIFTNTEAGKIIETGEGVKVTINEGFLVLVSVNDITRIPENILRRFHHVPFDSHSDDLIWQARVLMADETTGESWLQQQGRSQDEHDLAQFLLWWEALGRHNTVAFNSNALVMLCQRMKAGKSFGRALDSVLVRFPGILPLYIQMKNQGGRRFLAEMSNSVALLLGLNQESKSEPTLTLADLNLRASLPFWRQGEHKERVNDFDSSASISEQQAFTLQPGLKPHTLEMKQLGKHRAEIGDRTSHTLATLPVPDNRKRPDVLYSSPLAQSGLWVDGRELVGFDQATSETLPVTRGNGEILTLPETASVLGMQWVSENRAYAVISTGQGTVQFLNIEKVTQVLQNQETRQPIFKVTGSLDVSRPVQGQCGVATTAGAAILSFDAYGAITTKVVAIARDSVGLPFKEEEGKLPGKWSATEGLFGSVISSSEHQAALWLSQD